MALALLSTSVAAEALTVVEVRIEGVEDEVLANLEAQVTLARLPANKVLSEAMLAYQLRQVPAQVATAMEPFGYFDAEVEIERLGEGDAIRLRLRVTPGDPVRVTTRQIELLGEGAADAALAPLLLAFEPSEDEVFVHARYEASKAAIERGLLGRGYFRARSERTEVLVERAALAARIDVAWATGPRHHFGETTFSGSHLRPGLLEPLLPYAPGDPYQQSDLLRLHRALVELDYFGLIDVQPELRRPRDGRRQRSAGADPEAAPPEGGAVVADAEADAESDLEIEEDEIEDPAATASASGPPSAPIRVNLTPAKRSRYSAGLSFGTDSGAAVRLGLDRRWVNDRGHKLEAEAELGQRRSLLGLQYRIPEFADLPGWWTGTLTVRDEEIGGGRSQIGLLRAARTARWRGNQLALEMNVQSERFEQVELLRRVDRNTFLVYPALRFDRVVADDLLYPSRGYSLSSYIRAGSKALGSDVDFAQLGIAGRWIRGLGADYRLLLRAEAATSWVDDFDRLPPSLRNYAGGDRSVRGYGYQELAPLDPLGEPAGGRHLAVASVELERRLGQQWAVAAFVDAGNAFDSGGFEPALGVGLGLRWRSPVGPVRVDIGHGLDEPRQSLRLHIGIGPEL